MKYITPNDKYKETGENFTNRFLLRKMLSEHAPGIPLTGKDIIETTNVSVDTLKSYWNGRRTIPFQFIEDLAKRFEFNTDYFSKPPLTKVDDDLKGYVALDMPKEVSALFRLFEALNYNLFVDCATFDGKVKTVSLQSIRTFSLDIQCIYIMQEKCPVIAYAVHQNRHVHRGVSIDSDSEKSYSFFLSYIKKMLDALSFPDFSMYNMSLTDQEKNHIYQRQAFYYLATDDGASLHDYKLSKGIIAKNVPQLSEQNMSARRDILDRLKIISETYTPAEAAEIMYPWDCTTCAD